jgi:hypothetical protein
MTERNRTRGQEALFAALPLDPHRLADLLAHERAAGYAELELNLLQRAAAEEAVREVIAGRYRRAA